MSGGRVTNLDQEGSDARGVFQAGGVGGGPVWHPGACRDVFGQRQNGGGDRCRRQIGARAMCRGDPGVQRGRAESLGHARLSRGDKAAVGVGGSYGEGALIVGDKPAGYYSAASASIGLQLGAQKSAQIIMFMTAEALDKFRNSSGWEAGANAQVTMIDQGKAADINSVMADNPVIAFVFGQTGLMGDLSVQGSKITKLEP
jgi:hypothetical protein